jgi:hypothetical protein
MNACCSQMLTMMMRAELEDSVNATDQQCGNGSETYVGDYVLRWGAEGCRAANISITGRLVWRR